MFVINPSQHILCIRTSDVHAYVITRNPTVYTSIVVGTLKNVATCDYQVGIHIEYALHSIAHHMLTVAGILIQLRCFEGVIEVYLSLEFLPFTCFRSGKDEYLHDAWTADHA